MGCLCVCNIIFEHLSFILECSHMIYSGPGIILVCEFYRPSDVTLLLLFFSGITRVSGSGASNFIISNLIFGNFSLFGVTVKYWLLIDWKRIIGFFAWFTGWISSVYEYKIGTLRGYELVIVSYFDELFI